MINFTVDTYFEYFLTLVGWVVSNALWALITQTGIVFIPFIIHAVRLFLKAREQGEDEGNKGGLLFTWLEQTYYVAILVLFFTCVPMFQMSLNTLQLDMDRTKQCGHTAVKVMDTPLGKTVNTELGGKTAAMPLWWGLVHTLTKGVVHGAIAAIPCHTDLRQLRFDVQHTRIDSPVLRQEVQDFVEECYAPARAKIRRQQIELDEVQSRDLDWIGSSLLVNTPGLYDTYRSQIPRKLWNYDARRDYGLPNNGTGGYPSCQSWWAESNIGLRARLLKEVSPSVWDRVRTIWFSDAEYEDIVLRSVVRPENITVSSGTVYGGYGGSTDFSLMNSAARVTSMAGGAVASLGAFPAFDSMRQSLPMVQGIMIMVLIICIPIVTVMSGYDLKTISTLSFVLFGVYMLSFWWELARWLDTTLLDSLYSSDTHSSWNMAGLQNTSDDMIVSFVMGTMFLVVPALWLGAMSYAGVKAGQMAMAISNGSSDVKKAGGSAGEAAGNVVKAEGSKHLAK